MFKTFVTIAVCGLSFISSINLAFSQSSSEEDKLNAFFKQYLEEHFKQQPLAATTLDDHWFDAQLDDISTSARAGWLKLSKETLAELPKRVDYHKLTRDGQIDYEIFQHDLETSIWETKNLHLFEEDPRVYGDYINDSVYLLLAQSTLPKETNIANCLSRMAQISRIVAEARRTLKHPSKSALNTAILQNKGAIDFYKNGFFELVGDSPQLGELKSVASSVVALLRDYQTFLEDPLMHRAAGNWRLGRKKFERKFELEMGAGISAEENLAAAVMEFDRARWKRWVACWRNTTVTCCKFSR